MLNQVFLARFRPEVTRYGPWKNALKMGRFGTKNVSNLVKNAFFQH